MFKKLLSNLSFNPSLINQLSFYSKRLRKEGSIRKLGLIFVALSMVIQLFAVIAPAEPSFAKPPNDVIPNGFQSQGQAVNHCNANDFAFKTILGHFGVACEDLFFGSVQTIRSTDYGNQLYSMGRQPFGKPGEVSVNIPGAGVFYMRPLSSWDQGYTSTYQAIVGRTGAGVTFMVLFNCGNIVLIGPPPTQKPPKQISCANLIINVTPGSKVPLNSVIGVRGQAVGSDLPPGELVHMFYDYIDAKTGAVLGRAEANGVPFGGSGSSTATDSQDRTFKLTSAGHFIFRLAVKYNNNGTSADASGNGVGGCVRDVYVETPPEKPEKVIECSALIASFGPNQKVVSGSSVRIRGQATGRNLPQNEKVDMYYDYIDSSGKVVSSQKALGIGFNDSVAEDKTARTFKLDKPGRYTFRLAVKYDSSTKNAAGNQTGNCAKPVEVEPPCEGSKNNDITECIILSKKARNETQNIDNADGTEAHAGDIITYSLFATNTSKNSTIKKYVVEESIADILEYADVTDFHDGVLDANSPEKIVRWPATDIKAGQTIEKKLTIKIKTPIPLTNVPPSSPGSFDLTLTNVYGNTVNIKLPPSTPKTTEQIVKNLPNTGPGTTLLIGFTVTTVVGYFFARSRLMAKEIEIVRTDYAASGGTA